MIQEIGEHKFDLSFRTPEARDEDFVLYMKRNKTLLRKAADDNYEIPRFQDFPNEKGKDFFPYRSYPLLHYGFCFVRRRLDDEVF